MKIIAYIHPIRTYLPCTGVGRHINQMILGLTENNKLNVALLFSQQWLAADGKLDMKSPLRNLPAHVFPTSENFTERLWKSIGYPQMDRYLPEKVDWLYAPAATYIPVSKCPIAVTFHDIQAYESNLPWSQNWQHRWFRYKWERWVRRAVTEYRLILTVSEFTKQRMVELLQADPSKIVVVGNGVDPAFFQSATITPDSLPSPIDAPYILIIGGLRRQKGADHVLAVAKLLSQQKSDLQIVVAGDSETDYIAVAKLHKNITLLGMVPDHDLPRILRRASLLLFLSPYEGFGIPAVEAMAAGVPAVVSNCASLPEVVGDAGIVVDPKATAEIVEIIHTLQHDAQLRTKYITRGQQRASQYTWPKCVDRLLIALKQFA